MADQKVLFEIYLENGEFKTRAKESSDALGKIGDSVQKSESAFSKLKSSWIATTAVALSVVYAFTKVGQALGECIEYASKLQETQNKFDVVFKNSRVQATAFAKTLVESYGLATEEAMAFLAGTGDILTGLGMQSDKALDLSNSVAQLGIDLASFSNVEGGAERAVAALTSALTGEREALKAYGIVVSEEMIKAELQAQGKNKLTGLALNQAKAEATLAIAYSQSGNAIGDMARSFDSYANIQRRVDSRIKDFKAGIGEDLLPAMSNLGLAFLSASKDGGILSNALKTITRFIGDTINSIALLVAKLDTLSSKSGVDKANKDAKTNIELNKKILQQYGTLTELKKQAETSPYAKQQLATFNANMAAIKKNINLAQEEGEVFKKKNNELAKIQERIANSDKVLDANKQEISNREKERKAETVSTGDGKDKQADLKAYYSSIGDVSGELKIAYDKEIANAKLVSEAKLDNTRTFEEAKLIIEEKYRKLQMEAFQKDLEERMGKYSTFTSGLTQLSSGLSDVIAMNASNKTTEIDNETQQRLDALNTQYEAQVANINSLPISESEKNAKLKALDENRAREEKALQEKAAKDKRKIAREAAEIQKKIAIFETTVTIPQAAFQAWKSAQVLPYPASAVVGGTMAAFATGLGLAKLKMIQEQPLPSYAVGTWAVPRDMTAQIHKDEMIVPKTFSDSVRRGEATIGGPGGSVNNNFYFSGPYYDKEGFVKAVADAGMDIERSTGLKMFTRK